MQAKNRIYVNYNRRKPQTRTAYLSLAEQKGRNRRKYAKRRIPGLDIKALARLITLSFRPVLTVFRGINYILSRLFD